MTRVVFSVVMFCAGLAACAGHGDHAVLVSGVGTDLYTSDLQQKSDLLDSYTGEICRQASLPLAGQGTGYRCDRVARAANMADAELRQE